MNFSQMSLDNGILHLANWVGNVIMPTIAAVFIIMAMYTPFSGVMRISSSPLRDALSLMGH